MENKFLPPEEMIQKIMTEQKITQEEASSIFNNICEQNELSHIPTAEDIEDFNQIAEEMEKYNQEMIAQIPTTEELESLNQEMNAQIPTAKEIKKYIEKQRDISIANINDILGVTTGINSLDIKSSGYKKKELNLIASRIGYGKTSLVLTSVIENINDDKGVLYFSMDLSKEQLLTRIISMQSGVTLAELKRGIITDELQTGFNNTVDDLSTKKLFIDDTKYCDIEYIKSRSKEILENKNNDIEIIVVDYFELIESNTNKNIARELKKLAIKLDIPIVLLSQLSDKIEKRFNQKPKLSDLTNKNLEIESDTIVFLYVDDYVQERIEEEKQNKSLARRDKRPYESNYVDKPAVEVDITIAKQLNGYVGFVVKYQLVKETSLFRRKPLSEIDTKQDPRLDKYIKEMDEYRSGYQYSKGLPYVKDTHKDIVVLDADKLKLKKIPKEILNLDNLEVLRIQDNNIKELPKEVFDFKYLEALCLCNNKLQKLPDNLSKLNSLIELGICNNSDLKELPSDFSKLKLTSLSIDGSLINKYIDVIAQINTLVELEIHGSKISKEVFTKLTQLPNLEELTFTSIDNKKFPKDIGVFKKVKYLTVKESKNFRQYNHNISSDLFEDVISVKANNYELAYDDLASSLGIPDIF